MSGMRSARNVNPASVPRSAGAPALPRLKFRLSRIREIQIFSCLVGQISGNSPPSPRLQEGTQRDRHGTLARVAMDACGFSAGLTRADENTAAYGEVVWSWRRDPGVKLAGSIPLTTVAKEAAHRGEHEANRKAIARGKPG